MSRFDFTKLAVIAFALLVPANSTEADPFDVKRLLEVNIEMPAADWKTMRYEHHDLFGQKTPRDPNKSRPNPYNYYRGNVTIDGKLFRDVGLRKKGLLGSVNAQRPSIKINFDKFGVEQEFEDISLMTLNNNDTDASQIKQHLSFELFRKAGIPAPRCNFARVTVNGKYLGVYSNVESVRKSFLKRHFKKASGNLYEGAISDFTKSLAGSFDVKTNEKKNDRSDMNRLMQAAAVPDEKLFESLESIIDLDQFYRYWAMECLVGANDGYASNRNNFFVYNDPTSSRFHFIPWGTDGVFRIRSGRANQSGTPFSVMAEGVIAHRLYKTERGRKRYRAELLRLFDEVWIEAELAKQIDTLAPMLRPHTHLPPHLFNPAVERVREFITERRTFLAPELTGPIPLWPRPLRESSSKSTPKLFSLKSTFNTQWTKTADLTSENETSDCSINLTHGDKVIRLTELRAAAAVTSGSARYGFPVISVRGRIEGKQQDIMVNLVVEPDFFRVSDKIPIDGYTVWGFIRLGRTGATRLSRIGWAIGNLKLTAANRKEGEPVSGSFEITSSSLGQINL
tara:strand:+ start:2274 stop:3971 length:1698 start_codon:yes stop_codon:yes gene_type:complete